MAGPRPPFPLWGVSQIFRCFCSLITNVVSYFKTFNLIYDMFLTKELFLLSYLFLVVIKAGTAFIDWEIEKGWGIEFKSRFIKNIID